jgi:hypothetical protein
MKEVQAELGRRLEEYITAPCPTASRQNRHRFSPSRDLLRHHSADFAAGRRTALRAEEPPAAIFIAWRAITRCASNPSNVPSTTANHEHLFPFLYGVIKSSSPQESRRNFSCASCWGYLTALLVGFPFTLAAI